MKDEQEAGQVEQPDSEGYTVQVLGVLDQRWLEWFEGLELTVNYELADQPLTTITCHSVDQARLRGILNKIWDLNLRLVSVTQSNQPSSDASST